MYPVYNRGVIAKKIVILTEGRSARTIWSDRPGPNGPFQPYLGRIWAKEIADELMIPRTVRNLQSTI